MRGILGWILLICLPVLAGADIPTSPQDICALMAGEAVPEGLVTLDAHGDTFDLSAALTEKPTLLIFYRGGW